MEMTIGNFIIDVYSSKSLTGSYDEIYHMDFYTCDKVPIVKIPMNYQIYDALLDNMNQLQATAFGFEFPPHAPFRNYTIYMEYIDDEYPLTNGGFPSRYVRESEISEPYLEDYGEYVHIMITEAIYPNELSKEVFDTTLTLDEFFNIFGNMSEMWMINRQ